MGLAPLLGWGAVAAQEEQAHVSASMREGRVTLSAHEASLRDVLAEFGRVSGIAIHVDSSITADETTSVDLERVPPEDGLRRLLRAKNFVFVYSDGTLAEVRAFTRAGESRGPGDGGEGRIPDGSAPSDAERREALRLRARALGDANPNERVASLHELAAGDDEQLAVDTATRVLETERVADVLRSALSVLASADKVPLEPVLAFVSGNRVRDPEVRIQAMELMADRSPSDPRVKDLLVALASRDGNREVRESAQNLLETLTRN